MAISTDLAHDGFYQMLIYGVFLHFFISGFEAQRWAKLSALG